MADNPKKRKEGAEGAPASKRSRFSKPQHNIHSAAMSTAYPSGEIDTKKFMRAHENEIKSMENAMRAAKKGLARRAFQEVPRDMRRRTASHNPQRVPKRIKRRAKVEALEDNTPISKGKSGSGIGKGKTQWLRREGIEKSKRAKEKRGQKRTTKDDNAVTNQPETREQASKERSKHPAAPKPKSKRLVALATPDTPPSRFRRRQVHKTWLPTHIWHTKRARMTLPKEPLWRFAIPLAPVAKAYRHTHRAATLRGAVAWDMSYMATIGLEGAEASILGLLKGLHFAAEDEEDPWQARGRGKKWVDGMRAWDGWIYEREGKLPSKIAEVTVIWCTREALSSNKRKLFIRVHPSAFLQLWNEVIRISKVQKPAVTVEDLRFEIGSIELVGPSAAETLCSVLHPSPPKEQSTESPGSIWGKLATVTNPGVLPASSLLGFCISDPRLRDPPKSITLRDDAASQSQLIEILADWPVDRTQTAPAIFKRDSRLAAGSALSSQKSINSRKSAAIPGKYPDARPTDPEIPILTYVSRKHRSWTVILPWKCVMPVWRGILRYPVSSGGNPRFGCLKERRQVGFEQSKPCFPFDFPGTDAGWGWELQMRVERKTEWTKRPKGKRVEWATIDLGGGRKGEIGDPWACDWERLLPISGLGEKSSTEETSSSRTPFRQLSSKDAFGLTAGRAAFKDHLALPHLFTVKITMIGRGTPATCARIYRLPSSNPELRGKWMSLLSSLASTHGRPSAKRQRTNNRDAPEHIQRRHLAQNLLNPTDLADDMLKAGDDAYPLAPGEEDLIGFATTGNYNLAEGQPTAIANVALHRLLGAAGGALLPRTSRDPQTTHDGRSSMADDRAADDPDEGVESAVMLSPDALADLTQQLLEDTVANIIHSTALSCHRAEKLLRMQSAATRAESLALSSVEPQSQAKGYTNQPSIPTADTGAAKYENGRVFLRGNPLKTTPEITCPHCKLPRLMHPIMGKGMQNPDLTKEYCMLYPWVQRSGHDVYGNPFPTDMAKSKKERELIKQQQKNAEKESVGTPGSQDTDMAGGEAQGKEINKLNTGGKPASYIPWHTCPSCKRSLLITRFAQHLEKCLGISGRQSSRNAMAKLTGQNGNGTGTGMANTPLGSRMGTPAPGSQDNVSLPKSKAKGISPIKRTADEDDEGDNDTPERKKKKKSSYVKKADREKAGKEGGPLKIKMKNIVQSKDVDRKARDGSEKPDGKRGRDDATEPDGAPRPKKLKLSMNKVENGSAPPSAEPLSAQEAR
ncbi:ribonucleases P/MRP protein subunit POP1-domain-containing protein [Massariosphaeria phaeospora]|uniref:SAGA-associated factor 11 n=1 Tax=Massariosphaeria phaeospora TaxID=100035 RepID=A0A7C8MRA8_9PLEO|nr:ribonucleases P/MRP protein subunit POP1-domain-containing protein [Massariosphaeria phaeospora]